MLETSEREGRVERAYLVGLEIPGMDEGEPQVLLEELRELVNTLEIGIVGEEMVKIRKMHAGLMMGSGKAESVIARAKECDADVIVFDESLSPAQQRNWEKLAAVTIVDRQEVILDIFAQRARTKEAVLQVELARQEYYLPRLKRAWTHLSRQRGGGAMQRNEGETQLEADQRMIRKRISRLKKELAEVVKHRDTQRKQRMKIPLPTSAIIGYTNAGKSSLLNSLTGAKILAEDKLFATLDPTTRRLELPNGQVILLTDTVGFVRRLPHRLVNAFKATLEEAIVGNFLIHVIDVSSPDMEHHMETTDRVMRELGAEKKQAICVFNKMDLLGDGLTISVLRAKYPDGIFISTKTGEGIETLIERIEEELQETVELVELLIPHDRYDLVNRLHELGAVKQEEALDEGVRIVGNVPKRELSRFEEFRK